MRLARRVRGVPVALVFAGLALVLGVSYAALLGMSLSEVDSLRRRRVEE